MQNVSYSAPKLAGGSSPCQFIPAELDAWADGAQIVAVTPAGHPGRVVKVVDAHERAA
jgi:hypothetical protein